MLSGNRSEGRVKNLAIWQLYEPPLTKLCLWTWRSPNPQPLQSVMHPLYAPILQVLESIAMWYLLGIPLVTLVIKQCNVYVLLKVPKSICCVYKSTHTCCGAYSTAYIRPMGRAQLSFTWCVYPLKEALLPTMKAKGTDTRLRNKNKARSRLALSDPPQTVQIEKYQEQVSNFFGYPCM